MVVCPRWRVFSLSGPSCHGLFVVLVLWHTYFKTSVAADVGSLGLQRHVLELPQKFLQVNGSSFRREHPRHGHTHSKQMEVTKVGGTLWSVILAVVGIFGLLAVIGGIVWASHDYSDEFHRTLSRRPSAGKGRREDEQDVLSPTDKELMRSFGKYAQTGELDIYTCMGLSSGENGPTGPRTKAFLPVVFMLIVMQMVLPFLLAAYVGQTFRWYAIEQDILYRLIGLILYLYSVVHLYNSALDDCRTMFLQIAVGHNVSPAYVLPMLFGEFLNALTSLTLTVTLFVIFCSCHSAHHLLIHCVAINFVLSIDNEWTSEEMRQNALVDFESFKNKIPDMEFQEDRHTKTKKLEIVVHYLCTLIRVAGTLVLGACLGIVFLLGNQQELCSHLQPYDPWPICIENPTAGGLRDLR